MIKWFKERTRQEKVMIIIIIMLLIGVILRWGFIKKEVGDAVNGRFERIKTPPRELFEKSQDDPATEEGSAAEPGE